MKLQDLAPWIAIAFTLALSILVPLFTQIANNRHQRKMQREKLQYEEKQKKVLAYEEFLLYVGASIAHATKENLPLAGSSIEKMYIYSPSEWWDDLDSLSECIRHTEFGKAAEIMKKLSRLISKELSKS